VRSRAPTSHDHRARTRNHDRQHVAAELDERAQRGIDRFVIPVNVPDKQRAIELLARHLFVAGG
jgi:hypothetical protein